MTNLVDAKLRDRRVKNMEGVVRALDGECLDADRLVSGTSRRMHRADPQNKVWEGARRTNGGRLHILAERSDTDSSTRVRARVRQAVVGEVII